MLKLAVLFILVAVATLGVVLMDSPRVANAESVQPTTVQFSLTSGWAECNGWDQPGYSPDACRHKAWSFGRNPDRSEPFPGDWSDDQWLSYAASVGLSGGTTCGMVPSSCVTPPPPPETCDGQDNDGNGQVDEGCPPPPPVQPSCSLNVTLTDGYGVHAEGTLVNSDSRPLDTLDWGDGNIEPVDGSFSLGHTYSTFGTYTITLTVINDTLQTVCSGQVGFPEPPPPPTDPEEPEVPNEPEQPAAVWMPEWVPVQTTTTPSPEPVCEETGCEGASRYEPVLDEGTIFWTGNDDNDSRGIFYTRNGSRLPASMILIFKSGDLEVFSFTDTEYVPAGITQEWACSSEPVSEQFLFENGTLYYRPLPQNTNDDLAEVLAEVPGIQFNQYLASKMWSEMRSHSNANFAADNNGFRPIGSYTGDPADLIRLLHQILNARAALSLN